MEHDIRFARGTGGERGIGAGLEPGVSGDLAAGSVFAGRYRVERRIAVGGMGAVYQVVHIETNRRRALKIMHAHYVSSDELRQRFHQEARVSGEIDSEYVVDVFDAGIDDSSGMPFLVMELLRGEDLGRLSKRTGAFTREEVVQYLYETSLALDKSHRVRIIHRDLKPDNLFLCLREHGPSRIKVLDFGIAKIVKDSETQANTTRSLGTPLYMSPEQFQLTNAVSPATDVFALGMIAFTLLVGKPYWHPESTMSGEMWAFAMHVARGPVESPCFRAWELFGVELPPAFDEWFFRATASDPAKRFASAGEAVLALAGALHVAPPSLGYQHRRTSAAELPIESHVVSAPPAMSSGPRTGPTMLSMTPSIERTNPAKRRRFRPLIFATAGMTILLGLGTFGVVRATFVSPNPPPLAKQESAAVESPNAPSLPASPIQSSAPSSVVVEPAKSPVMPIADAVSSIDVSAKPADSSSAPEAQTLPPPKQKAPPEKPKTKVIAAPVKKPPTKPSINW